MMVKKIAFSIKNISYVLCGLCLLSAQLVQAQNNSSNDSKILDQIITPDLERRTITEDKLDSEDWEIGIYTGFISIEDFGSDGVIGLRTAYHITEDFFIEGTFGTSEAGETSAELLGGGAVILTDRDYSYYNVSVGWNLLPGEIFIGSDTAFNTAFYVLFGVGNTRFNGDDRFTYTLGAGLRFYATDSLALHATVKDHLFDHDVFGETVTVNNLEATFGVSMYF